MRVSLSAKHARALLSHLEHAMPTHSALVEAYRALQAALAPRKLKPIAKVHRQAKAAKKLSKRDETSAIYAEVSVRAAGVCEACGIAFCGMDPAELDHQAGRDKARQTVENCWLLHGRTCHRAKTNPKSARVHLERFIAHAEKYGYRAEAERARARLEGIVAVREREASR